METLVISPDFTIEDIHKCKDYFNQGINMKDVI